MIIKRQKLIGYILILFLILNGGSIVKILLIGAEFQMATMLLFFTILILSGKFNFKKIAISISFILPAFLLISLIQNIRFNNIGGMFSNQIINFTTAIIIAIMVSVYFEKRKTDFPIILNNILKVLVIHAILSSLLLTFFPTKNILFTAINDERINPYVGYGYIFFQRMHLTYLDTLGYGVFNFFDFEIFRAHGIFWEPGVFATYANIFIFLNLFIFKKRSNVILGLIAIFLSWSTTGMTVLLIQIFYYLFRNFKFNIKGLLQIIGSSILIFMLGWLFFLNIDNKVYGDSSGSAAQRYIDTMAAVEIVKNFPITGIGIDFELFNEKMISAKPKSGGIIGSQLALDRVNSNGFSNSLFRIFVYFGLPLGFLLLFSFYKQDLIPKNKGLFAIINFICLSASPILFLTFHFTFIINGLMNQIGLLKNKSNVGLKQIKEKKNISVY